MKLHYHVLCSCLLVFLTMPTLAFADDTPHEDRAIDQIGTPQWMDPPAAEHLSRNSDSSSDERQSTTEVRIQQLEDRAAIILQDLKVGRRRDGLQVRAKATIREVEDLTTQTRIDEETARKVMARAEVLKKQLESIINDQAQISTRDDAASAARSVPSSSKAGANLSSQANRSTLGMVKRVSGPTSKARQTSRLALKNTRQARNTGVLRRAAADRPFALPSALRPISF